MRKNQQHDNPAQQTQQAQRMTTFNGDDRYSCKLDSHRKKIDCTIFVKYHIKMLICKAEVYTRILCWNEDILLVASYTERTG